MGRVLMFFELNRWVFLTVMCVFALLSTQALHAQTRSLDGAINLDAPADQSLQIEISVRNHAFVVTPVFGIIRPIISVRSVVVVVQPGQTDAQFSIDGISVDAVDYTIQYKCLGCSGVLRTQYYSPDGTRFGLANSVYIDPDDLVSPLNTELQTLGQVSGTVNVLSNSVNSSAEQDAPRSVRASVVLLNANTQQLIDSQELVLGGGSAVVAYQFSELRRTAASEYFVELRCGQCEVRSQRFSTRLTASRNHQNINFNSAIRPLVSLPFLYLLLHDDEN